ncbi:hypothetical protein ACHWQZ_G008476 [Mnemiopsis leidyi]
MSTVPSIASFFTPPAPTCAGFPSAVANLVTTDVFWHHNGQVTDQDPSFDIFSSDDEVFEAEYCVKVGFISRRRGEDTGDLPWVCTQGVTDSSINLLTELSISLERLLGQGYDGASVMSGIYSGVQKLIADKTTSSTLFVHCSTPFST